MLVMLRRDQGLCLTSLVDWAVSVWLGHGSKGCDEKTMAEVVAAEAGSMILRAWSSTQVVLRVDERRHLVVE